MAWHPSTWRAGSAVAASFCVGRSPWLAVAVVAAACVAGAFGASGGGGADPQSSTTGGGGPATLQVDAHATIDYSSADALFPDLAGVVPPACSGSAAETRHSAPISVGVDGGSIEYLDADDVLAGAFGEAPTADGFDASMARVSAGGWPDDGPGRAEGSGFQLRRSLSDVLVVLFSTTAYRSLQERFHGSDVVFLSMTGLRQLRRKYKNVTYAGMRGCAWDLGPSGTIGIVLKFGSSGPRNTHGQHEILVVTASLTEAEDIVCA